MAISNEIEKLEKRWHENPAGLMFTPLAEAHRRAGDPTRALEILEAGLTLHANYFPALIVRGRCHLDTGNYGEAEAAFDQVLAEDPDNTIALRGVAEVYEKTGRDHLAIAQLEALLDQDRGDAEARLHLERLRHQRETAPPTTTAAAEVEASAFVPPDESAPVEPGEPYGVSDPAEDLEPAVDAAPEYMERVPDMASDFVPLPPESPPPASDPADAPMATDPEPPAPLEFEPTLRSDAPAPPSEWGGPIAWTPAPRAAQTVPTEPEPANDPEPPPEMADAFEPEPEPAPEAVEPLAARVDEPDLSVMPFEEDQVPEPAAAEPEVTPLVPAGAAVATVDAPESGAESELVITESMAELFLRQGHRELALAVYRQLAEREPDGTHLREVMARLEADQAPAEPAAAPPPPARDAATTGGRSVEQFLQSLLEAPPPDAQVPVLSPPAVSGAPTRASSEPLSLGAVFGEEPQVPPPSEASAATEGAGGDAPSYDEFFGAAASASERVTPAEGADDLRQFNDWLRGLKR